MSAETAGSSRVGYVVALLIFIIGSLIALAIGAFVVYQILQLDDSLDRVVVPGSTALELDETGRYTIFYEPQSTVDGRDFDTGENIPDLEIRVTSLETGEEIPVTSAFGDINYDTWDRSGESIGSFRIDEPGRYEITAEYVTGVDGPEVVLAIGEGIGTSILLSVGAVFGAGLIFCLTTLIALIVVVITLVRRSRNQSAAADSNPSPR